MNRAPGWVSEMRIGKRESYREEINSDGFHVSRWLRIIGDYKYSFTRVEDANRNAYVDVWIMWPEGGDYVRTFHGKTTRPKTGVQVFSEELGKLIRF